MKLSRRHLAIFALASSAVIWGAAAPIFKWSMEEIPPYTLALLRFLLAAIFILPFVYKYVWIKKSDFIKMLYLAFFGVTLDIALFFIGLQLTTSINVPILNSITPIFLIFGSVLYLGEKIKLKVLIGTILSLCGVLLIVLQPLLVKGPDGSILGNILILLSILSVIVYTLLLKKYDLPYPALVIVFWTFLLGSLLFLPGFITEAFLFHPFAHLEGKALIGIAYGAVFSSALGYFLYNYGLEFIDGTEIGVFSYIQPIITILVAIPLLGEKLTPIYIIGSIIVFIGLFVAEARYRPHLLPKKHA